MPFGRDLIKNVMEECDLKPKNIPKKYSHQSVYGKGSFVFKGHGWSSRVSHILVDLKNQRISYIYGQKPKDGNTYMKPHFREKELSKMIRKVVERCMRLMNGEW